MCIPSAVASSGKEIMGSKLRYYFSCISKYIGPRLSSDIVMLTVKVWNMAIAHKLAESMCLEHACALAMPTHYAYTCHAHAI